MLRPARPLSPPSARMPTRSQTISHPSLPGLTERVERVVDHLEEMRKSGEKHLSSRQFAAAQIFRRSFEVLHGSVGGCQSGGAGGSLQYSKNLVAIRRERLSLEPCGSGGGGWR
jgi:hypothetical protein